MTQTEQLDKVREYVRAGCNREWANKSTFTLRSKPLRQIADELGMEPEAVRSALLACGWYDAAMDAERADPTQWLESVARASGSAPKKTKGDTKTVPLVVDPQGWDE